MSAQTHRITKNTPRWDWLAALILLVTMQSVAARLVATDWVKDLEIVLMLTLLGCITGLALGVSRFSTPKSVFFVVVYSLFFVPWQLGLMLGRGIPWLERMVSIWGRIEIIVGQLIGKENVTDPLLFIVVASSLAWLLSIYAGYTLIRHGRAWQAILPGSVAIIIISYYSYQDDLNSQFLAIFFLSALLLLARVNLLDRKVLWQEKNIPIPFHIGYDLILGSIVAAGLIVALAWNIPTITEALKPAQESWEKLTSPWDSAREEIGRIFAALKSSVGLVTVGGIKGYYGDELPLGLGIPLTDDLVFTIEAPALPASGMRYYWRARHYEAYDNGLWSNQKVKTQYVTPDEFDVPLPEYADRWETDVKITTQLPVSTLYTPAQPFWVSRPVELETTSASDGEIEIAAIHASQIIMAGETYQVRASLSASYDQILREAGTNYPAWVTDKYLQLPPSVTPRTRELAQQIAGDLDNPYDQVEAITAYLRSNITYVDVLPEPPEGQEPIDWMLFENREGFCNYYATAEVILARALGIPARLAVGYSQGEQQVSRRAGRAELGGNLEDDPGDAAEESDTLNTYHVVVKNAHTWPEIFFPGYGWVEFEPTVNQAPLLHQADDEFLDLTDNSPSDPVGFENDPFDEDDRLPEDDLDLPADSSPEDEPLPLSSQVGYLLLFVGVSYLVWGFFRRFGGIPPLPVFIEKRFVQIGFESPMILKRWARWSSLSSLERSFHEVNKALNRLGAKPSPADTPHERTASLVEMIPNKSEALESLLEEYQSKVYGNQVSNLKAARSLARRIKFYSYRAWLGRLFQKDAR